MRPKLLSKDELSLVTDSGDKILLEIIKGMDLDELRSFDVYKPDDLMHYNGIQARWLCTEKHLLCHRGGCCKEITEEELIADIYRCNNGERFRVFYVFKYPKRVSRTT